MTPPNIDAAGRVIDYLRLSVTDRCNERCLYCMPENYKGWAPRTDHLAAAEVESIVRAAAAVGFRRVRLTGGEPLIRSDIVEIAERVAAVGGIRTVALSTNATRLGPLASELKEAGVRSINISLDALDAELYRKITGGAVQPVLEGITAAIRSGFDSVKLNCVLMRGVNESQIWPLIEFAAEHQVPIRFIELMPLSRTDRLTEENFLPVAEVLRNLQRREEVEALPDLKLGAGPARYYRLRRTGALVGFIGAITVEHFCEQCNKVRITADGKLRPCLGDHLEMDLRPSLRVAEHPHEALRADFLQALRDKPKEHGFTTCYQPERPMTAIGG